MNWKLIRHIDECIGIPLISVLAGLRKVSFKRTHDRPLSDVRRILLVKFWGIGNIFMILPSVAALRRSSPGATIDLLTLVSSRQAAECTGAFDGVYTVNTVGIFRFLRTTAATINTLRRRRYEVIVDFEQFARFSAICIALIGGDRSIGFRTAGQHRHFLFTRLVRYDNAIHITRSYYSLAVATGAAAGDCRASSVSLTVPSGGDERLAGVRSRLGIGADPYVIFHVGTSVNFHERRWPAAQYAALTDRLSAESGPQVVLTGLEEESAIAAEVVSLARCRDRVVDASGRLNFQEYFDLIRASRLVVSADTAAVHIASSLGVPVVGLYGPNTPTLYGPWGEGGAAVYAQLSCSPCITNFNAKTHVCRHREGRGACMKKIQADEVFRIIKERYSGLLEGKRLMREEMGRPCSR